MLFQRELAVVKTIWTYIRIRCLKSRQFKSENEKGVWEGLPPLVHLQLGCRYVDDELVDDWGADAGR
jgi:hypothetical protein